MSCACMHNDSNKVCYAKLVSESVVKSLVLLPIKRTLHSLTLLEEGSIDETTLGISAEA